ncbi:class I SAM-dependent methyltransferase [Euzebya tangerina]|uniref:class I SAM-dependent methyltransferase n=1 Tax=Euzebya tangerina TaxID=591198 RepID=UPI000E3164F2|nr:class I SAM-dependent methyltransferase [Euzebya tangerina]
MKRLLVCAAAVGGLAWLNSRQVGIRDAVGVQRLYDRVAGAYDVLVEPYDWVGGRRLQRRAVSELHLSSGDTVVDLGTGTGWNLPFLAEQVGREGQVIGVDLSEAMLARARRRVDAAGFSNVEFIRADLREYEPPATASGVIAGFALEMVPEQDAVIRQLVGSLRPGARIASVGLREPEHWPNWAVRLGSLLNRPFGVNPAYRDITPWTSIRRHLSEVIVATSHAGAVYLAVGTIPDHASPTTDLPPDPQAHIDASGMDSPS